MKKQRLLQKILSNTRNVRFNEMVSLVEAFGFRLSRISSSHHIFTHPELSKSLTYKTPKGMLNHIKSTNF
jgi:predicted RNA binding protein YcfA (HicA-like mRNA interferase family)